MSISKQTENLLVKAESGKDLHREDIISLLKIPADFSPDLFAAASQKEEIRARRFRLLQPRHGSHGHPARS